MRIAPGWVEQIWLNPGVQPLPYQHQCHLMGRLLLPSFSMSMGDELPGMYSSKVKETSWTDTRLQKLVGVALCLGVCP